jgi:hypothetical protein
MMNRKADDRSAVRDARPDYFWTVKLRSAYEPLVAWTTMVVLLFALPFFWTVNVELTDPFVMVAGDPETV